MSSLEKCLFKSFAHFLIVLLVFLEWSHVSSLYILKIKPLSKVSLASMFSHTVGCLSIVSMFSSAVQKLFVILYLCSKLHKLSLETSGAHTLWSMFFV